MNKPRIRCTHYQTALGNSFGLLRMAGVKNPLSWKVLTAAAIDADLQALMPKEVAAIRAAITIN